MSIARVEHFGKLLEPGLREIFYEAYDQTPTLLAEIFSMQTTENPYEEDIGIGAMGDFPDFDGTIEYDRMYQGYNQVYTFPERAKGFAIERKLYDDERYNIINKRPVGLAIAAIRRREDDAAALFNNAFSASYLGFDGKRLCASDHPSKAYVDSGGAEGVSARANAGTLAFSADALQTTKNLMRNTKNDRNQRISVVPDTIVCPPPLEEKVWSVIASDRKVDSSDWNPNIHQGRYKMVVWDNLTGTTESNSPWFLIDSRYSKMFLNFFDRIPIEFAMEEDFDTLIAKFRAYMRYGLGWSDWVWVFGQDPS